MEEKHRRRKKLPVAVPLLLIVQIQASSDVAFAAEGASQSGTGSGFTFGGKEYGRQEVGDFGDYKHRLPGRDWGFLKNDIEYPIFPDGRQLQRPLRATFPVHHMQMPAFLHQEISEMIKD